MSTNPERPVILWDCDDCAENFSHSNKNEAIEAELDQNWDLSEEGRVVTVYGYARMIAPEIDIDHFLGDFFETNWAEYQGEDGAVSTAEMRIAAETFLETMRSEFVPFTCEQVTSEEVDVAKWIAEHKPDWLKQHRRAKSDRSQPQSKGIDSTCGTCGNPWNLCECGESSQLTPGPQTAKGSAIQIIPPTPASAASLEEIAERYAEPVGRVIDAVLREAGHAAPEIAASRDQGIRTVAGIITAALTEYAGPLEAENARLKAQLGPALCFCGKPLEVAGGMPEDADSQGATNFYACPDHGTDYAHSQLGPMRTEVTRLRKIIDWMLGEDGEFPYRPDGQGLYWWRKELRARAALGEN